MNFLFSYKKKTLKIFNKINILNLILIVIIFLVDRYSKLNIIDNFNDSVFYFNSFINFDLIWNTGVGFGLFNTSSNIIYNSITIFIGFVITILIFIMLISDKVEKIIYSLIIGGALGNFYDRIYFQAVPDFIDFHYKNFHWFTFNIADIFITIGLIVLIIYEVPKKNNEKI
jgi:signal peptidase II